MNRIFCINQLFACLKMGKFQFVNVVMEKRHLLLGKLGEAKAGEYLLEKGYRILDRNWRYGHLELDLVCELAGAIIFVEVKTRSGEGFGGASRAVTPQKQRKLILAALMWLQIYNNWDKPCRFDVICCTGSIFSLRLEHFQNAFDLSGLVDNFHASW